MLAVLLAVDAALFRESTTPVSRRSDRKAEISALVAGISKLQTVLNNATMALLHMISGYVVESREECMREITDVLIPNGFIFYVAGLSQREPPGAEDEETLRTFEGAVSRLGASDLEAELRFYRWNTWRIVAGTERAVPVFKEAGARARDMRQHPLHCIGYNIKAVPSGTDKPYKAYVEITREFLDLFEPRWLAYAVKWPAEDLTKDFSQVDYVRYPQVRAEVERILDVINQKRRDAGLPLVLLNGSSEVTH